jgi:hypothetical protein
MIRCILVASTGLIVAIGIVEENVRRMKAHEPLTLPLGELLAEATKMGDVDPGLVHLMVAYGETHVAIIERWNSELESSGLQMPEHALADARALDDRLRSEGLM